MVVLSGKGYSQIPGLLCDVSFADLHGARTVIYAGTDAHASVRLGLLVCSLSVALH